MVASALSVSATLFKRLGVGRGGPRHHHLPYNSPASARTVGRRLREESATTRAARRASRFGEARATRRQARGGRASYKAPRSGGVQGRRDVAANAPGSGGPARCEHARDVGGDERGDVHVVCGRICGVRRVARASYGATTAPLGATKRPNWRESPKNRFSGGASVHKSRHVCRVGANRTRLHGTADLSHGTDGFRIKEPGR